MNKFVMVVFSDESKAYQGIRELQDLHRGGSVSVYGTTVVGRDASGGLVVKQRRDEGPIGMGVGALTGTLIGLFAGPAGAAIGLMAGGVAGTMRDYLHSEVSDEFLDDVQRILTPGKYAVIAEVSEDWLAPIDTRMEALGGTVVREGRQDFIDDLIEKRADARKAEFEEWKAERAGEVKEWKAKRSGEVKEWKAARAAEVKQLKTEIASDKAERIESGLEAKLERAREKLHNTAEKARERLGSTKAEMEAKLDALEAQVAKAEPEVRGRIEKRMAEVRDEFATREKKLARAYELTQEALR